MGNCHTAPKKQKIGNHTKHEIGPKTSKDSTLIQLRLTSKRKKEWETWLKHSRFEICSQALFDAIITANKFKRIQKMAKESWLAELLSNNENKS